MAVEIARLPRNIRQKMSPQMTAAFRGKNVRVQGGMSEYSTMSSNIRQKGLGILFSETIAKKIIAECADCISRFSESDTQFRLSILPVVVRKEYWGKYISIKYKDSPNSDSYLKKISLPTEDEKPALYFVCGKSRLPGEENSSAYFHVWTYVVFDPNKSDKENIEGILNNKHVLHRPGVVALKAKNSR